MMEFTKKFGKAICVVLYGAFAYLAAKKKPVPLLALAGMHLCEYFTKARKVAKEHAIDQLTALANCLCFGFTWWLPIDKGE